MASLLIGISVTLAVFCLVILVLKLRATWVLKLQPRAAQGIDKIMLKCSNPFMLNCFTVRPCDWNHVVKVVRNNTSLLLSRRDSPLKIFYCTSSRQFKFHSSLSLNDILQTENDLQKCLNFNRLDKRYAVNIKINPKYHKIFFFWSHGCFDGVRFNNEIAHPILEARKFSPKLLCPYFYQPFLTEWRMLSILAKQLTTRLSLKKIPLFSDITQQSVIHHKLSLDTRAKIKSKYNCSSQQAEFAIFLKMLFFSLEKKYNKVSMTLLSAMPPSTRFRNNFGLSHRVFKRSLSLRGYIEQIKSLSYSQRQINAYQRFFSHFVWAAHMTNYLTDCQFSPMAMHNARRGTLYAEQMLNAETITLPCSQAIYCCTLSSKSEIIFSTTINTPAIQKKKLMRQKISEYHYQDLFDE